jgi:hypothetical protein
MKIKEITETYLEYKPTTLIAGFDGNFNEGELVLFHNELYEIEKKEYVWPSEKVKKGYSILTLNKLIIEKL